jgi:histidinol-phosphate aminotransferase
MSALALLRPELRAFQGYRSARSEVADGDVWLDANEAADTNVVDADGLARRYPAPQPPVLREALGRAYGVPARRLLLSRGSDEAIDLLVRAFCRPGVDAVLVTPPVFGMYAVCGLLHGARVVEVPLREDPADFTVDLDAVREAALAHRARVVFLCSPGNPAGGVVPAAGMITLARALCDDALVVVDEAYVEFAGVPSLAQAPGLPDNLVVLRTLSKAHALAGARIGCAIAAPEVVSALRRCQAPYPVPAPSAALALRALAPDALARTREMVTGLCERRGLLGAALERLACVRRVYPSRANFMLVRFRDADAAMQALRAAGVVVRDMRTHPALADALRITVGTADQNARLLAALEQLA